MWNFHRYWSWNIFKFIIKYWTIFSRQSRQVRNFSFQWFPLFVLHTWSIQLMFQQKRQDIQTMQNSIKKDFHLSFVLSLTALLVPASNIHVVCWAICHEFHFKICCHGRFSILEILQTFSFFFCQSFGSRIMKEK